MAATVNPRSRAAVRGVASCHPAGIGHPCAMEPGIARAVDRGGHRGAATLVAADDGCPPGALRHPAATAGAGTA